MKKLIVLAVAAMFATNAFAADMKWNGSAGWRYESTNYDDQLNSTNATGQNMSKQMRRAHALRANLGATGGSGNVEYGAAVRTNNAANTDWANVNNAADLTIGLSEAWFKYSHDFGVVDVAATIGRQANVFAFDASQQLFDNDVHFDGFGWKFTMGSFGLNASQYILGAHTANGTVGASSYTKTDATDAVPTTQNKFSVLYGFQPWMNWKFTDEISTMFAVGYYLWNNYDSPTNTIHGGYNTFTLNTSASGAGATVQVDNPKQWQFYNTWSLPFNLGFSWELVLNKKYYYPLATETIEMDNTAFTAGLAYGKVKRAHDWAIGYNYGSKGLASVINTFTYDKFAADNKGHTIWAKYALADNFHLGWKGLFLKEKAKKDESGRDIGSAAATGGTAMANYEQKTNYWELTAGVTF